MKKIAFLFTGQSRCNPLSHNANKQNIILDSYSKYIFTEEFKKKYEYDIFISTDDINIEKTINYFGKEHIKNIHLFNTNFILNQNRKYNIPDIGYYIDKYNSYDKGECNPNVNSIHQQYKIRDAYNLLESYTDPNSYFLIFRIRLDIKFTANFMETIIDIFENNNILELIPGYDLFAAGKPRIMKEYCCGIDNKYGTYNPSNRNIEFKNFVIPYDIYNKLRFNEYHRWRYAPETQLFEVIFDYCDKNNVHVDTIVKPFHNCHIVR